MAPHTKYDRNDIPSQEVLLPASNLPKFSDTWSYCSVIGKLNFLAQNTRPDIAYAVHQCTKYCNDPRETHGTTIKRISQYLKKTSQGGLILQPDGTHQLNAYCDADFAGNWSLTYSHLYKTAILSRMHHNLQWMSSFLVQQT